MSSHNDAAPSSNLGGVGCGGSQPPIPNTYDLEADNSINAALKASLRGATPYTEHTLSEVPQAVEQLTLNQRVQGSSPCAPTR
jgi:hypothetical protein